MLPLLFESPGLFCMSNYLTNSACWGLLYSLWSLYTYGFLHSVFVMKTILIGNTSLMVDWFIYDWLFFNWGSRSSMFERIVIQQDYEFICSHFLVECSPMRHVICYQEFKCSTSESGQRNSPLFMRYNYTLHLAYKSTKLRRNQIYIVWSQWYGN